MNFFHQSKVTFFFIIRSLYLSIICFKYSCTCCSIFSFDCYINRRSKGLWWANCRKHGYTILECIVRFIVNKRQIFPLLTQSEKLFYVKNSSFKLYFFSSVHRIHQLVEVCMDVLMRGSVEVMKSIKITNDDIV